MLFTHKVLLTDPKTGQKSERNVVFAIKDETAKFTPSILASTLELFNYCKKFAIKVGITPDYAVPLVFAMGTDKMLDCSSVYEAIKKKLVEGEQNGTDFETTLSVLTEPYVEKITAMLKGDRDSAELIFNAAVEDYQYLKRSAFATMAAFGIEDIEPMYLEGTREYLRQLDVAKETINLRQESCTDKLFLRLPTRAQLLDETVDYISLIPNREDICEPYNTPVAYTSSYKRAGSGVPKAMFPLIEGIADNNTLPIQENEQEFYDTLIKWMEANIKEEFGAAALEVDDKDIVLDSGSQWYLEELINVLYSWHWSHNPSVPKICADDSVNSDGDSDDNSSRYVFTVAPGEEYDVKIAAFVVLQEFVTQAVMKLGYKAYADVVIKLCRWGERKPTAIYLEGYPFVFDLGTSNIREYAGSISEYEQARNINGSNLIPNFAFMDTTKIVDTKYIADRGYNYNILTAPVGLVFSSAYTNRKDTSKTITVYKYFNMIDFVSKLFAAKAVDSDDFKPDGFDIAENGTIIVPSSLDISSNITTGKLRMKYQEEKNTLLADPFYISQSLQDVFFELKASDSNRERHQFAALDSGMQTANLAETLEENKFSTLDELADKCANFIIANKDSAIELSIFAEVFPIYLEVAKRTVALTEKTGSRPDLTTTINLYKDVMLEMNYAGESRFLESKAPSCVGFKELYKQVVGSAAEVKEEATSEETKGEVKEEVKEEVTTEETYYWHDPSDSGLTMPTGTPVSEIKYLLDHDDCIQITKEEYERRTTDVTEATSEEPENESVTEATATDTENESVTEMSSFSDTTETKEDAPAEETPANVVQFTFTPAEECNSIDVTEVEEEEEEEEDDVDDGSKYFLAVTDTSIALFNATDNPGLHCSVDSTESLVKLGKKQYKALYDNLNSVVSEVADNTSPVEYEGIAEEDLYFKADKDDTIVLFCVRKGSPLPDYVNGTATKISAEEYNAVKNGKYVREASQAVKPNYVYNVNGLSVVSPVSLGDENVGYIVKVGSKTEAGKQFYVLLNKDYAERYPETRVHAPVAFEVAIAFLMKSLLSVQINGVTDGKIFFEDVETMQYYIGLYMNYAKTKR